MSIDGMGIVLFSPEVMRYVVPGSDFLTEEFTNPKQVGEHIRKGISRLSVRVREAILSYGSGPAIRIPMRRKSFR